MNNLLMITPCSYPLGPGRVCGQPPAGVDTAAGRFLCSTHFRAAQTRATADELPAAATVIEGVFGVFRANDEHMRELRERGL
jgi:hypothetical protein